MQRLALFFQKLTFRKGRGGISQGILILEISVKNLSRPKILIRTLKISFIFVLNLYENYKI